MSFISRPGRHAAMLAGIAVATASLPAAAAQASATVPATSQVVDPYSVLNGVYCTAAKNCWAVGFQGSAMKPELNRVLHWNGRSWNRVPTPNPGGGSDGDESGLAAVRCLTASNCWAVGHTYHNDIEKNQVLHWNGKKWSVVRTPNPGGSKPGLLSQLFDVTCVSSANCWAVGDFGNPSPSGKLFNEVLHWNGKRWSQVRVVNPGGTKTGDMSELFAVRCGSARNCNAVGTYGRYVAPDRNEVLHWNGTRWSHVSAPNPAGTGSGAQNSLQALACGSGTNCWAPGLANGPSEIDNEMLHWNGRTWTKTTVPNPNHGTPFTDNELLAGTCTSTRNCWAVGQQAINGSTGTKNEALHWNGKHWSLVSTPNPGGTTLNHVNVLLGVRCTSASSCWAVGKQSTGGNFHQEILFWHGGKWKVF